MVPVRVNIAPPFKRGAGNEGSAATGVRAKSLGRNKRSRTRSGIIGMVIRNLWYGIIRPRPGTFRGCYIPGSLIGDSYPVVRRNVSGIYINN